MASIGSYARFIVGILLSLEVLRMQIFGELNSTIAFWLALLFVALSASWAAMKISGM
jgi:hypothetical protein